MVHYVLKCFSIKLNCFASILAAVGGERVLDLPTATSTSTRAKRKAAIKKKEKEKKRKVGRNNCDRENRACAIGFFFRAKFFRGHAGKLQS